MCEKNLSLYYVHKHSILLMYLIFDLKMPVNGRMSGYTLQYHCI